MVPLAPEGPKLPPGSAPGDPLVVGVFQPPKGGHGVERAEHGPPASELPQHPADGPRALEPSTARLDRPNRPPDLLPAQAQPLSQARLLVWSGIDSRRSIVPLDPACQPNSKFALAVVDEDQPIKRHGSKLH